MLSGILAGTTLFLNLIETGTQLASMNFLMWVPQAVRDEAMHHQLLTFAYVSIAPDMRMNSKCIQKHQLLSESMYNCNTGQLVHGCGWVPTFTIDFVWKLCAFGNKHATPHSVWEDAKGQHLMTVMFETQNLRHRTGLAQALLLCGA